MDNGCPHGILMRGLKCQLCEQDKSRNAALNEQFKARLEVIGKERMQLPCPSCATLLTRVKQLEEGVEWVLSGDCDLTDYKKFCTELRRRVPLISP